MQSPLEFAHSVCSAESSVVIFFHKLDAQMATTHRLVSAVTNYTLEYFQQWHRAAAILAEV
jgi:hypothetical protein